MIKILHTENYKEFVEPITIELKCKTCRYRRYTLKTKTCLDCIFTDNFINYKPVNSTLDSFYNSKEKEV